MKTLTAVALVIFSFVLSGCASNPQLPVALNKDALITKPARIGVAMTALPKVDTHLPGADCLLCIAAASIANSSLTDHTRTLPYEDLPKLKYEMADLLRQKGKEVVVIEEPFEVKGLADFAGKTPNEAKKDFSPLRTKYGVDKLLVIDISMLGVLRNYSAYFPTSDPKGVLQGTGYLVDLTTNSYDWYLPVNIVKAADSKWDEPPKYPGLTNAYFQTLELGKDSFLKPFVN